MPRAAQESETTGTKCALCMNDLLRSPRNAIEVSGCGNITLAAAGESAANYSKTDDVHRFAASARIVPSMQPKSLFPMYSGLPRLERSNALLFPIATSRRFHARSRGSTRLPPCQSRVRVHLML